MIHKNNLRKYWEIIKDVIKIKKNIDLPDKFNIDNVMVTDKLEIALNFNNFYVNIGKTLSNDIPTNSGDPLSIYLLYKAAVFFVCLSVCLYPPFFFDTTVVPQPNLAHIFGYRWDSFSAKNINLTQPTPGVISRHM